MSYRDRSSGGFSRASSRPSVDRVRAPYNFVPLSDIVVQPAWGCASQQDRPFADAISGSFEVTIDARTPLFVRGQGEEFFHFTEKGEKRYAIPGSSVRGMLRNVIEIATFSLLERVNDHRYGVRDLHNRDLYGRHMATILNRPGRPGEPVPLVSAGWMSKTDDPEQPAEIVPCSFAKIEYNMLLDLARKGKGPNFDPGIPRSAPERYRAWGERDMDVDFSVEELLHGRNPEGSGNDGRAPRRGSYGKVTRLGGPKSGRLVFTGQPNRWHREPQRGRRRGSGGPKHHDFVFYDGGEHDTLKVSRQVFRDFTFVHGNAGEQHRLDDTGNAEWRYWRERAFDEGGEVPVFFLLEGSEDAPRLRAIGLAMMFRLAYRYSTRQAVRHAQPAPDDPTAPDLARLLFGHVDLDERADERVGARASKGRVSVGLCRAEGRPSPMKPVTAVLGAPKASYYPNYLEQNPSDLGAPPPVDAMRGIQWTTYMDKGARARGWKRYQVRQGTAAPIKPTGSSGDELDTGRVETRFRPLPQGTRFSGRIRVHNLRPEELGALLWAIDFGGDPEALHAIGMARSLGYGAIRLSIGQQELCGVDGQAADLGQCVDRFTAFMEEQLSGNEGGWASSRQIFELLALSRPAQAGDEDLRHMLIHHPDFGNEFVSAKKGGLVLEAAGSKAEWRKLAGEHRSRLAAREQEKAERAEENRRASLSPEEAAMEARERQLESDLSTFREAFETGGWPQIARAWIEEGGELATARRAIVRDGLGRIAGKRRQKLQKKYGDIMEWLGI